MTHFPLANYSFDKFRQSVKYVFSVNLHSFALNNMGKIFEESSNDQNVDQTYSLGLLLNIPYL